MLTHRVKNWLWCIFLLGLYFELGKLGLMFAQLHPSASLIWPSTGLALAAFLLLGYQVWPGIFIGAFLVNITTAGSIATSIGIATGNTLEGIIGCFLINQFANGNQVFNRPSSVFKYFFYVGLFATFISPLLGVASLTWGGFLPPDKSFSVGITWWLGDVAGAVVIAPLIITFVTNRDARYNFKQNVEFIALLVSVVLIGLLVFRYFHLPTFLCIPVLVWASTRFSPREATFANFLMCVIAIWGTWKGFGPFSRGPQNESLLFLQSFMTINSITAVALSALVAEEKRAQKALRQKDREFVDSVENAALGLHWMDSDGTILWANKAELALLGYKEEEYIGRPVQIFHTHQEKINDILQRLKKNEILENYESTLQCKDGSLKHVLISSNVYWEDGKFIHTRCITQDITKRKEAEEKLTKVNQSLEENIKDRTKQLEATNQALHNQILERKRAESEIIKKREQLADAQRLAKMGSWEWDIPTNTMSLSEELYRIFEIEPSDFEGTFEATLKRIQKDHRNTVRDQFETAYRDHAPFQMVAKIVCPSQKEKAIEIQGKIVLLEENRPVRMIGICQDITEKKRLIESQLLHAQIVESSDDAIVSFTMEGLITSWNRGAEQLYGWKRDEALGRHVTFILPAKRYNEFFEMILKVKQNIALQSYETVRVSKEGKQIDVSVMVSPIKDSLGKLIGVAKIARDITTRKLLEKAVLEATDSERQRIGQDLHDGLGQQLLGIGFLANVLKKNLMSKSLDDEAEDAALVEEHINQALSQTRMMARQMYLAELEKYDLATALKQLTSHMEIVAPIECQFECDTQIVIDEPSVRSALYRISQEALSNAVKHSQGKKVTISLSQQNDLVTLVVKDDGVGIKGDPGVATGIGLRNMTFRANTIGATLEIQAHPNGGTMVKCTKILSNHN